MKKFSVFTIIFLGLLYFVGGSSLVPPQEVKELDENASNVLEAESNLKGFGENNVLEAESNLKGRELYGYYGGGYGGYRRRYCKSNFGDALALISFCCHFYVHVMR
jgi:hypothetical protein